MAQYYLGLLFSVGEKTEFDKQKAIHWHEVAFKNGVAYSGFALGTLLDANAKTGWEHQDVEPFDSLKSQQYFRQAIPGLEALARAGDQYGAELLALIYFGGRGVEPDAAHTLEWFRLCYDNGSVEASNMLWSITSSLGNDNEAVFWFRRMKQHGCQALVDFDWEKAMVAKTLLQQSELTLQDAKPDTAWP